MQPESSVTMRVAQLGLMVVMFAACGIYGREPRHFFEGHRIGSATDYGLFKGDLNDHVASFHGFADDRRACEDTALLFNGPGGGRLFFCAPLNR